MFKFFLHSIFFFKIISLSAQTGISQFADPTGNFSTSISGLCIGCSINDASNVADNSLGTYATIAMTAGAASTYSISAKLDAPVPGGTYAGFYIQTDAVTTKLPAVTVRTYKAGAFRETIINGGELSALLGGNSSGFLCGLTNATFDYDEVSISFTGELACAALIAKVYYAFGGYTLRPMSVLPVLFASMSVSKKDNGLLICWRAINDENTSYEVQSSNDGVNFRKIGSAESDDIHGIQDYQFTDPIVQEKDTYYRIKATGVDSRTIFFSNTILVQVSKALQKKAINVFPNPMTGNKISISLSCKMNTAYTVNLLDTRGKIVYEKRGLPHNNRFEVDLKRDLAPGIYIVRIEEDFSDEWVTEKILVQRN